MNKPENKSLRDRLPVDWLQLFAEGDGGGEGEGSGGGEGGEGQGGSGEGDGKEGQGEGSKTFTQEVIDKIVSKTIARERSKWEKDFETKLEAQKSEAEKLAKMNADQRAEHERTKRENELAEREAAINRRELRATALEQLAEKSLPTQLAELLVYTDAESTNSSIAAVETAFRAAVETAVHERLKGDPPRGGGGAAPKGYDAGKSFAEQRNQKGSGK